MTSEHNDTQVKSRADYRKSREEEQNIELKPTTKEKREKRVRIRILPIWLRLLLVAILLTASALAGVVVGYGVIGDGKPGDALKKSTWEHIVDLVKKDTER